MAPGVSRVGWGSPIAQHGQQQRGHSGRISQRSSDVVVGRVTFEVQGDEKLGLAALFFFRCRRRSTSRLC